MIVAGIMSGTSADGINVALVRLVWRGHRRPRGFDSSNFSFQFLAQAEYPYPKAVRQAVLQAMNASRASVADLARLNFLLAELYSDAVLATQRRFRLKAELIGCHGQTLYHQGASAKFMGRRLAVTWQTGEGAVIAARVGVPVVSDFRPADMAAGGKGAPLVPFLDYLLYRDQKIGRIVQNIGGIANLTAIPAAASSRQVIAFDTGPGNMVIDAVTDRLFGKSYDRDGRIAASGRVIEPVVSGFLRLPFFRQRPPKTAGREEFGREFVRQFLKRCGSRGKTDVLATATALTARSIADAVSRFVLSPRGHFREFVVSGGGANNPTLLAMLANELRPLQLTIRASDEFGLPSEAKEAAAFALMAYETWNHRPSNIPSATGAKRPAILERSRMPDRPQITLSSRATGEARSRAETSRGTLILFLTFSKVLRALACAAVLALTLSCSSAPDPNTLVMIIESSPTNLDPRVGLDAQSERIDDLIFDDLLTRDAHLNVAPGLAEHWEIRDPLTYVFRLHHGVKFHDGRPLTARDVKWTFDALLQGKIRSTKSAVYRFVESIEVTDDYTVVFHLKEPFATLLWNLSDGAIGIVPYGSGEEISRQPIGSGPFRFVSAEPDKEVILARNDQYWGEKARLPNVRFIVVPDTTTRALELRKGSADIAINALTSDMVLTLEHDPNLAVLHAPGTVLAYLAFNLRDPILKDERVRQALAYAIDRRPFLEYLQRGFARPANSVLPPESWAYNGDVPAYDHDPARARQLLQQAGYREVNGVRFHLTMKSSTEESTRLMAAVLQQQLRQVGIALDIRTFEFATFFSDVTHGLFQLYSLRWIGGNEDPDIFEYIFHSAKFPPNGANRGYFADPRIDALIDQARHELDQNARKQLYAEIQRTLADELPYINLWYFDNVLVHSKRVRNLTLNPSGNYDFLKTAELGTGR